MWHSGLSFVESACQRSERTREGRALKAWSLAEADRSVWASSLGWVFKSSKKKGFQFFLTCEGCHVCQPFAKYCVVYRRRVFWPLFLGNLSNRENTILDLGKDELSDEMAEVLWEASRTPSNFCSWGSSSPHEPCAPKFFISWGWWYPVLRAVVESKNEKVRDSPGELQSTGIDGSCWTSSGRQLPCSQPGHPRSWEAC